MIVLALIAQVLRMALPYWFAAAGGVLAERAGVISLGLEGYLLGGAFVAALASHATGSVTLGVLAGVLAGTLMALLHAVVCIRFRANQVVSGIAINLLALGGMRFWLQHVFHSTSNTPRVPGFEMHTLLNPLLYLGLAALPALAWLMERTVFGLRLRAAGEHPEAVVAAGVDVRRVQYLAVAASGAIAALGGAFMALDQHQFADQMTAGRGFIALAAVIFGRWQPLRVASACLLFAAAEALQIQLQGFGVFPFELLEVLPHLLTIILLAGLVGRVNPPAALGRVVD